MGVIVYGLISIVAGILFLFSREYAIASIYFGGAVAVILIAYVFRNRQIHVRPRTALGVLLIGIGAAIFFYNDIAAVFFASIAVFAPFSLTFIRLFAFWIIIASAIIAVLL